MNREYYIVLFLTIVLIVAVALLPIINQPAEVVGVTCSRYPQQSEIILPQPGFNGLVLEDAIAKRRSVRSYSSDEISLEELSMLLWAGNGITSEEGFRSVPSAGALYPIDLYVIPNRVEDASCGLYRYVPEEHSLFLAEEGEFTEDLYGISYGQSHVRDAAVLVLMISTPERTTEKYGETGEDYVFIEAGHIGQNILLEAVSLDLGAVPIGGFDRKLAEQLLDLDDSQELIYLVAVGKSDQDKNIEQEP